MTLIELYTSYENSPEINFSPRNRLYAVFATYFLITHNEAKLLFYHFLNNARPSNIEQIFGIRLYSDELKDIQKLINIAYLADLEDFSKETSVNITVTQSYAINSDKLIEIIKNKMDERHEIKRYKIR